jgi:hypothetical protein
MEVDVVGDKTVHGTTGHIELHGMHIGWCEQCWWTPWFHVSTVLGHPCT